jgi:hypothetical protein
MRRCRPGGTGCARSGTHDGDTEERRSQRPRGLRRGEWRAGSRWLGARYRRRPPVRADTQGYGRSARPRLRQVEQATRLVGRGRANAVKVAGANAGAGQDQRTVLRQERTQLVYEWEDRLMAAIHRRALARCFSASQPSTIERFGHGGSPISTASSGLKVVVRLSLDRTPSGPRYSRRLRHRFWSSAVGGVSVNVIVFIVCPLSVAWLIHNFRNAQHGGPAPHRISHCPRGA